MVGFFISCKVRQYVTWTAHAALIGILSIKIKYKGVPWKH